MTQSMYSRIWREENGVLTFEWILLITVLVIGIVGGISAVRDALIDELGDVSEGVVSLDQSYWVNVPLQASIYDSITFPVEDYISGSANAYVVGGVWVYTPSHFQDVAGEVTRSRPDENGETDTGHRLTQEVHKQSSVDGE
ncbi:MAG: hypothetical protein Q4A17_06085 [Thermoguttaceae bacterium]|nr:hypothetical protein [Thermoguttaceae bacterium]MDO4857494.1 hypothetical protein [Thermoguttaceae bacterium]